MAKLIAKASGGGDRPLAPTGIQQAVLYSVIDLGTQKVEYKGVTKLQRKINVGWELPKASRIEYEDEKGKHSRPQCIFKRYTLSLYKESALAKDLAGWRGQGFTKKEEAGFNIFNMLTPGVNALLNIVHYTNGSGETKAKYESIAKMADGLGFINTAAENPIVLYTTDMGDNFPENMPPWAIEAIKQSPEYNRVVSGVANACGSQSLNEAQQSLGVEDTTDYGNPEEMDNIHEFY